MITATTTFPGGHHPHHQRTGTSFTAGMWIAIESGTPRQEIAQVNWRITPGRCSRTAPLQYAHGTAATFWQITAVPSLVKSSDVGAT